jgi:hypothetical protein
MVIDELEIYLTPSGLGRAAIVRRSDGLLCIFVHWILSEEFRTAALGGFGPGGRASWNNDRTPLSNLYQDVRPEAGLFGTLDDARRHVRSLPGFSDALLKHSNR